MKVKIVVLLVLLASIAMATAVRIRMRAPDLEARVKYCNDNPCKCYPESRKCQNGGN